MTDFDPERHPHRRFNPLTGGWVLVSPQRAQRPWQGQQETPAAEARPTHDPACYLCPGNARAGGAVNPRYEGAWSFVNDFSALREDTPAGAEAGEPLFRAEAERGVCKVVCFSPRHDLGLAQLSPAAVEGVVRLWAEESRGLGARDDIGYVQVFENRGAAMGCSNPHPHAQIWASAHVPPEVAVEQAQQAAHHARHGRPLLADYRDAESGRGERLVYENAGFVVLVPYWATWPFETLVLPKRRVTRLEELDAAGIAALADAYRTLVATYDAVFDCEFPYSAGVHQAPADGGAHPEWLLHLHFYPPLLRSATVKKFMVGYELLAGPQRDLTPEAAAERLREARRRAAR